MSISGHMHYVTPADKENIYTTSAGEIKKSLKR